MAPSPRPPLSMLLACVLSGCVLGEQQSPGCRADHPEDCGPGWICRGGLCLRPTTPASDPPDPDSGNDSEADAPEADALLEPEAQALHPEAAP